MTRRPPLLNTPQFARHPKGVSLIEVLVSILLISLGILAMAALQVNAAIYSKTAESRAIAALLANDLADRMRANRPENGTNIIYYALTSPYSAPTSAPADASKSCAGLDGTTLTKCSPDEMAQFDLAQWRQTVFRQLPQGTAYVQPNGGAVDIWIAWTDPRSKLEQSADQCPPGFKVNSANNPEVRCMYFRIAL